MWALIVMTYTFTSLNMGYQAFSFFKVQVYYSVSQLLYLCLKKEKRKHGNEANSIEFETLRCNATAPWEHYIQDVVVYHRV